MDKSTTFCCEECGCTHVEELRWVDINTNKVGDSTEDRDFWCQTCGSIHNICTLEEYEQGDEE